MSKIRVRPYDRLDELLDFPKTQCRGLRNRVRVGNRVVSFSFTCSYPSASSCVDAAREKLRNGGFCRHSSALHSWTTREKLGQRDSRDDRDIMSLCLRDCQRHGGVSIIPFGRMFHAHLLWRHQVRIVILRRCTSLSPPSLMEKILRVG